MISTRSTLRTRPTLADLEIERVSWEELGPEFFTIWGRRDGKFNPEHVTVYGKSGGGKTAFVAHLLYVRNRYRGSHCVIVATKRADPTLMSLGWPIWKDWPPPYGETCGIMWIRAAGLSAEHRVPQRIKMKRFMDQIWTKNSNLIVYWDELQYIEKMLRLGPEMENFYREGRTLGITNIASMQRPSGVTRHAHSDAGWTAAFPPKDADDRTRVAEVLGDRARFRLALDLLDRDLYEFILRDDRTGATYVTHLPKYCVPGVRSRRR